MCIELDHIFICTASGAPEANELLRFGLREGLPNQHPGQGTGCRRFLFKNAMLELLWVSDENEAKGELARRTLLWERWSRRDAASCPFGICLRPVGSQNPKAPFSSWEYRPPYLAGNQSIHIGDAELDDLSGFISAFQVVLNVNGSSSSTLLAFGRLLG